MRPLDGVEDKLVSPRVRARRPLLRAFVLVPDLSRVLRVELALQVFYRLRQGLGAVARVVHPPELLVHLSVLPELRPRVVRVCRDHELVGHTVLFRELEEGPVDEVLRAELVELQLDQDVLWAHRVSVPVERRLHVSQHT